MLRLIKQVCKKLSKGKSVDVIADELEEDASVIKAIADADISFAPDYDVDAIYQNIVKK